MLLRGTPPIEEPQATPMQKTVAYTLILLISLSLWAIVGFFLFGFATKAHAYTDIDVVEAIKKTENSKKFPYGIKSVKVHSEKHARKICLRSVRNNIKRWKDAGMPGDFIVFMGNRYSPPSINPNWVRLVKHFLKVNHGTQNV